MKEPFPLGGGGSFAKGSGMADVNFIDHADPGAIAEWLARRLCAKLAESSDPVTFTMPGGSTPFPILAELTKRDLDWSRLVVWPGDDRIVAESHQASNTGKIRAALEPLGVTIKRLVEGKPVPHFAFAWLGMGGDGHIASLFPNTNPQMNDPQAIRRLTPDPLPPEAPFDRITLTIPALLQSDELLFVIRGDDKRAVFDAAVAGEHDLPIARLLGAASQPITCFT